MLKLLRFTPRSAIGSMVASMVASMVLVLLCVATPARADGISYEAALQQLVTRADLPLTRKVFGVLMDEMRRSAPQQFVAGAGKGAKLGPEWAPGDPDYDKAYALISDALVREEAANGPVFSIARVDVLRSLELPWSEDDLKFATSIIDTPLGRNMSLLVDAAMVSGMASAVKDPNAPQSLRDAMTPLISEARVNFVNASTELVTLKRDQAADYAHLEAMLGQLNGGQSGQAAQGTSATQGLGARIGAKLFKRPMQRFMAVAYDQLPAVVSLQNEFRQNHPQAATVPPAAGDAAKPPTRPDSQ